MMTSRVRRLSALARGQELQTWLADASLTESAALAGPMGAGKSQMRRELQGADDVRAVAFESTLGFVQAHGAASVGQICGGINSARARELVVRFGLINAWTKRVDALSSGELRKVTLARAVADAPRALLLDGAHDGLDPRSRRQLSALLASLARGMSKVLVDLGGTGARAPPMRARLLQTTHRPEEVCAEAARVFVASADAPLKSVPVDTSAPESARLAALTRIFADSERRAVSRHPSPARAQALLKDLLQRRTRSDPATPLAEVRAATVIFANTDELLDDVGPRALEAGGGLQQVDLTIRRGQLWTVAGANGCGKSTLSRLLSTPRALASDRSLADAASDRPGGAVLLRSNEAEQRVLGVRRGQSAEFAATVAAHVGVVSMDAHMRALHLCQHAPVSAADVIRSGLAGAACSGEAGTEALARAVDPTSDSDAAVATAAELAALPRACLARPFAALALGEQRLALMARALVHAPSLLVLDEAGQGLDSGSREWLMALQTALCRDAQCAVLLITHHADEVPDAASHLLRLERGRALNDHAQHEVGGAAERARAFIRAEYVH